MRIFNVGQNTPPPPPPQFSPHNTVASFQRLVHQERQYILD